MSEIQSIASASAGGTESTRFNALRHGVLSRYTVLPWEDADEYCALVTAFVAEHAPQGPTEEHLVEELVGGSCGASVGCAWPRLLPIDEGSKEHWSPSERP